MAFGSLLLRTAVGGVFIGHGLQKLTGAFEGPGIAGTTGMMNALGVRPAKENAMLLAGTETFGGAALVLGAATPAVSGALIATMVTAVRKVSWSKGFWNTKGGWEYNALLAASLAALASDGPGAISVDALFGKAKWGIGGGLFALAVGVGASYAVTEYSKRVPAPETPVTPPEV